MKTYIYADNYRGFSHACIPLEKVNFLVGENSTGKTSILDLIETFSDPRFWLLQPEFPQHSGEQQHFHDLVSASAPNRSTFTIGAVDANDSDTEKNYGMLVTYFGFDGRPSPKHISILRGRRIVTVDVVKSRGRDYITYKEEELEASDVRQDGSLTRQWIDLMALHHNSQDGFVKENSSEPNERYMPILLRLRSLSHSERNQFPDDASVPQEFRASHLKFAPIRSRPRRTYDAPQTTFTPEGDHTPYLIKKRLSSTSTKRDFARFLEGAGESSGLFKKVVLKKYGMDPMAPFEINVELGGKPLSLKNVGYGVSQALPLIVEMFVQKERTSFQFQQPEVHLHPRAQATFGDLIAERARTSDKLICVETHSDFLIDRFRLNVRRNDGIQAQILFFERTENGNKVSPIAISASGDLDPSQPEAYRSFFLNESLALLG